MAKNKATTTFIKQIIFCVFVLLIGVFSTSSIVARADINDEQVIKVGCFPLNGFFNIGKDGSVSGYAVDYTYEVFKRANLKYEYVHYRSWVEAYAALGKNEIDVLAPSQRTEEREKIFTFDSFPIGTEYGTLLTLNTNDDLVYEDFLSFNKLKVGIVPSVIFFEDFKDYEKRHNFEVDLVYYKDTQALISALNAGDVEAVVVNMMVKTPAMKLLARFGASPFYYMFSPKARYLREELSYAIDQVSSEHPDFQNNLNKEYFSSFTNIPFTKKELKFIENFRTLKVASASNYPPFSYINPETGEISGVRRAYLERVSEITGLKFSFEPMPATDNINNFVNETGIDIIAGVENRRFKKLHSNKFSNTYLTIFKYFIGPKGVEFNKNNMARVGYLNSTEEQLGLWLQLYPKFVFTHCPSIDECLSKIHDDKLDYMLEDWYSVETIIAAPHNDDLRIYPNEAVESNVGFKVLLSDTEEQLLLVSILDKAINQITSTEVDKFISTYTVKNRYKYSVCDFLYQYRNAIAITLALLFISIIAMGYAIKTRKKAQEAIAENELRLRYITNNIKGGVVVLRPNEGLCITFANDGFLNMIGCSRKDFEDKGRGSYLAYVHPDDLHTIQNATETVAHELSLELRVRKVDGSYVPALFNCTVGRKTDGFIELYCVILDLTKQNNLIEKLRIEKNRTDLILDRVDEIFYEVNMIDHSVVTSNSFLSKMGWTLPSQFPEEKDDYAKMWHTDEDNLEKIRISTAEMFEKNEPVSTIIKFESKLENRYIWCELYQYPILDKNGLIVSVIGLIRNVDSQVSERERLIEQAKRDPLTSLYNKEAFETIVNDTLTKLSTQNHALIFIDLDHFKKLNDSLGHLMGDRAICDAADKLRVIFSNYDVISRFGGDEFCVFVKNIPMETLIGKMDWLLEKLHTVYENDGCSSVVTCSCGISCTDGVGRNYKHLLKCADEALYEAKEKGRNRYVLYKSNIDN